MKIILHITSYAEWERAREVGIYEPETFVDDGFIHCSTASRVVDVANSYYYGRDDLLLVCIDKERVQARVKYEPPIHPGTHDPSPTDTIDLFPHIYGRLNLDAVIMVVEFPCNADGTFDMPRMVADVT